MDGQTYDVAEYENQQHHAKNLNTYISPILVPKGGAAAKRPPPFWCKYWPDVGFYVFCMILLIFIFCHSICLAIHFAISKDSLALYKKIRKKPSFLQPCKLRWRFPMCFIDFAFTSAFSLSAQSAQSCPLGAVRTLGNTHTGVFG